MKKILTAVWYEEYEDGSRSVLDILQPSDNMSEKQFKKYCENYLPDIKPTYEYLNEAPY